ncbi:lamin tail domain-containing protein [Patescibacteria group bacterium]
MKLKISRFRRYFSMKINKKELLKMTLVVLGSFFVFSVSSAAGIFMDEFMYNPKGSDLEFGEWLEICNDGDEIIDIEGWKLRENSVNHKFEFIQGESLIYPQKCALIVDNYRGFEDNYDDLPEIIIESDFSLKNEGESVELVDKNNNKVYEILYSSEFGNGDGYTVEFCNEEWQRSFELGGSPGWIDCREVENVESECEGVSINEIFPNPDDNEVEGEYIELYNNADKKIDLFGCRLSDLSSKEFIFPLGSNVGPSEFMIVYREDFRFAMNNSGEEMIIFSDNNGDSISTVEYSKTYEGVSYGYDSEMDMWRWTPYVTPNKENKFEKIPKIDVDVDKNVFVGVKADFEIGIKNINEDDVRVVWDFGDGRKSYSLKTSHRYSQKGEYKGSIKVFSGSEEFVENFKVRVRKFPDLKVKIIALMPNPKGKDSGEEWIELKNSSKKEINFKNWIIATGKSSEKISNHLIRRDFKVKAGKSRKIVGKYCSFSLDNEKGRIELRYPDEKLAYKLEYEKEGGIGDGETYQKNEAGKWHWAGLLEGNSTGGEKNEEISGKYLSENKRASKKVEELDVVVDLSEDIFIDKHIGKQSVNSENEFAMRIGKVILATPALKHSRVLGVNSEIKEEKLKRNGFLARINQFLSRIFAK